MGIIGISGKINSGKDTVGEIVQIISASPHFTDEAVVSFIGRPQLNPKWENKKFADKLKDMVCMLLGCTREQLEDREFKEKELGEEWWYIKQEVDKLLISYDKNNKILMRLIDNTHHKLIKLTPRLLLQLLGTEAGRQIIHPNIWVNSLMAEYKPIKRKGYAVPMQYGGLYKIPEDSKYPKNHWDRIIPCKEFEWEELPNWIITDMRFPNELKAVEDREGITIRVNRPCNICRGSGYHKMSCPVSKSGEHCSETALDNAEFDYIIENEGELVDLVSKVRKIMLKERLWQEKQ